MDLSRIRRPRYADVAATLALVLATSGTAYAVATVHTSDIADGAVTTPKLHAGAVTHRKLATNSIDGSNVVANSLTLSDLLGANASGSIEFSIGANACGTLSLGVAGAQVGQVVAFSFTGKTAVPSSVVFGGARVTSANSISVKACNVSGASVSVSNLGIRVATFG